MSSKFQVGDRVVEWERVSKGDDIRRWSGTVMEVKGHCLYIKADVGLSWIDSGEYLIHEEILNSPLMKVIND